HGLYLLVIGRDTARKAMKRVSSCERCNPAASTSFASVLDEVLGRKTGITDYVLAEPATCPNCDRRVEETGLVVLNTASESDLQTTFEHDFPLERTNVVLVDELQRIEAQGFIIACEYCADEADISFDYLLDAVTGRDPSVTEYIMSQPAKCPQCF